MATSTPEASTRKLMDIEARVHGAWATYREALRGLEGRRYEDAEDESWHRLQNQLDELAEERRLAEAD